ncbi:TonB-dependent receptor domain-containing protein [Sphingobium yanoikuyae]|uniref:TonB-dependent receptor domain-containing protein n=1 Tax=Sphingobium yanoikuyae TaxID=13690 RepID=UPI003B9191D4
MTSSARSYLFAGASIGLFFSQPALAQQRSFSVQPQRLSSAIAELARQANVSIVAPPTGALRFSDSLQGTMDVPQALARLLKGTGLVWTVGANGVYLVKHEDIRPRPASFTFVGTTAVAAAPAATSAQLAPLETDEPIIVTGTRDPNQKASASTSPITVISGDKLAATGQADLRDALVQLSPSITRSSVTSGNANMVDKISLRALTSNHTLILVNGKRRHTTSVITDATGPEDGTAPVDIGLIPTSAIDHVEVLLDGAAAIYGSDAIAGVINIILKNNDSGLTFTTNNGLYYEGDGFTSASTVNWGTKLGEDGFLSLSGEYRHQDHTNRGGPDTRVGEKVNRYFGNSEQDRIALSYNAGYNLSDSVQFYSFATYAYRKAGSYQNYRVPTLLPQVFPNGFSPLSQVTEHDFSITGGLKGKLSGWDWDLNATYGEDHTDYNLHDSVNVYLYNDTGSTPTRFNVMSYANSQLTLEGSLRRYIDLPGLAEPLNFAIGGQYRRDTYDVNPGEPASYYGAGTQGQSGLQPSSYVRASRDIKAAYIDLSAKLVPGLQLALAGRYEDYSDAGDTLTGKASVRYDFSPAVAVRGTISNGFRAPNMQEQYYTSLGTTPNGAQGVLAVNSIAARLLGAQQLKPEKSTNYSLGMVFRPVDRMTISIDGYQISIKDRIVKGGAYNGQAAIDALAAQGIIIDSSVLPSAVSAQYFSNGADTRTRGLDIVANYRTLFDGFTVDWDASANFNKTKVQRVGIDLNGRPLLTRQGQAFLSTYFPRNKFIFGGHLEAGKWDFDLHEIRWGKVNTLRQYVTGADSYSTTVFYEMHNAPKWQTNIELGYKLMKSSKIAVGATNLFDARPSVVPLNTRFAGVALNDTGMQQLGINGGYYYMSLKLSF